MNSFATGQCLQGQAIDGHSFWPATEFETVCNCLFLQHDGIGDVGDVVPSVIFPFGRCPSLVSLRICHAQLNDPSGCVDEWLTGTPNAATSGTIPNPGSGMGTSGTSITWNGQTGLNKACSDAIPGMLVKCTQENQTCNQDNHCPSP